MLLSRRGIAHLAFLKILLATHQKLLEPSFREVIDSFVLLAYSGLPALRTLLQQLLTCLKFTSDSKDLYILLVKMEKWCLWTVAAAKEAENHGGEFKN